MTDVIYPGTARPRRRPAPDPEPVAELDPWLSDDKPVKAKDLPPPPQGALVTTHLPDPRILDRKDTGLPEQLEALTHKALGTLNEVLDEPVTRGDEDWIPMTRLKVDAAKAVVVTQVRTDEARFRVRQGDQLAALLELVVKRKAELAAPDE